MPKYMIPSSAKDELQKKLEKLGKKATAYGNHLDWKFGEETVVTRNIYSVEDQTKTKTGEQQVFAVEVEIESDIIRKDGFTVVAQIETLESGKNIVKMIDDSAQAELEWYTMPLFCEHCHTHRVRRFTYIVKDESGNYKQVGKTCLKDYCGIDPKMLVYSQEIEDLILDDYSIDGYEYCGSGYVAFDVLEAIARANDIIKEHGYVKSDENNSTKSRLMSEYGRLEPSEESKKLAVEMQKDFSQIDYSELTDFQRNIKTMLQAGYIRSNAFGYIAYAPVMYKQMLQKREQEARRNQDKANSSYIGKVGDRITVEYKDMVQVTFWETVYGTTYLYKFTTVDGNVIVWFASKFLEPSLGKITGTVKEHSEYNGEKQTILTRCRISR